MERPNYRPTCASALKLDRGSPAHEAASGQVPVREAVNQQTGCSPAGRGKASKSWWVVLQVLS